MAETTGGGNTGSRWGQSTATGTSTGVGSSTFDTGNITISGVGTSNRVAGWTGPGQAYPVMQLPSTVFSDKTGNLSASAIRNLFIKMDAKKDPFLKQFMAMYGVTDKKVAKAIWDDAADYASKLAKSGVDVDFVKDVLKSDTFRNTYLSIPKSLTGVMGGAPKGGTSTSAYESIQTKEWTTQKIRGTVESAFEKYLGRVPTAAELREITQKLNAYEAEHPSISAGTTTTTTSASGKTSTSKTPGKSSGGVDAATFVEQQAMKAPGRELKQSEDFYDWMTSMMSRGL